MHWRGPGRSAIRLWLVALLALVAGACFEVDAQSQVGGDGAATSSIVIELDIGKLDALFGSFAESFGEEDGVEQPSLVEQFEADLDDVDEQLDELYEQRPDLRDKFSVSIELTDDDVVVVSMDARTETIEELEILYADLLSSSETGFMEIYDLDQELLDSLGGSSDDDTPGDVGFSAGLGDEGSVFSDLSIEMDGEFRFEATPVAAGTTGDEDLSFDLPGLEPEISISITAPGDVTETNGDADGRTVRWELGGSDTEPLLLVSRVDPSATAGSLGGGADDDNVLVLVLAVGALVALVVGGVAMMRNRNRNGDGPTDGPDVGTVAPAPPSGPPTAPPTT